MKKHCTLALLAAALQPAMAQTTVVPVPGADFESWSSRLTNTITHDVVPGWFSTMDFFIGQSGFPYLPASVNNLRQTTDAHSGAFAARLTTQIDPFYGPIPARLILGRKFDAGSSAYNSVATSIAGGMPCSARVTSLQFYYKLSGTALAQDSAMARVYLTRTANDTVTLIANGTLYLTQLQAAYAQATVPLQYVSAQAADSVHIVFSTGEGQLARSGTTLHIDDITLTAAAPLAAQSAASAQQQLNVYPNPSADGRFWLWADDAARVAGPYTITDLTGRVVASAAAVAPTTQRTITLTHQPAGIYWLHLSTPKGRVVHQLIIR